MSFRSQVLNVIEVVLRVPPLFVIDEILKIGLGFKEPWVHDLSNAISEESSFNITTNNTNNNLTIIYDPVIYKYIFASLIRLLLSSIGCSIAVSVFILNTKYLMVFYMFLMSIVVVFVSYWINMSTVKVMLASWENVTEVYFVEDLLALNGDSWPLQLLQNYVLQFLLAFIFVNVHLGHRNAFIEKYMSLIFMAPSTFALIPISPLILNRLPLLAALPPLFLIITVLFSSTVHIMLCFFTGIQQAKAFVSNYGMSAYVEAEWIRLNVPEVLRTFWILRVLEHTGIFFLSGRWDADEPYSPYFRLMKYLMVTGCDTLAAVLGTTSIVSYVCNYIGKFFQWILQTDDENDKNFGTVSAIVFYILALQTGLTGLEPEIRFVRLCRNFCLLFTALLHFTHNVVNPLLMSLSASHNPSLRRHLDALMVSAFLVILPITLMYFLWTTQLTSTWLLAVTAFSIEVIVKVFVSLSIYTLFLLDARRESFWEQLDDYIYYIKAFGNTVEFCFGIFLFFNGAWILMFESGSAIRAVMMCIHAYFNIWCDAKVGWSVFMKRRTAVRKIESLAEADKEELRSLKDVCAICYSEMESAKVTRCKHFFHGVCLRKWLYVQDRCPLCHKVLHGVDIDDKSDNQNSELVPRENGDER